ncbi:MAG: hypothetical protein WC720_04285 [Candidatus Shapirobacteria bacterium]
MNSKKKSLLGIGMVQLVALVFIVVGNVLDPLMVMYGFLIGIILSMSLVLIFTYMAFRGRAVVIVGKVVSISCVEILLIIIAVFYFITHGYIVNSIAFFWIFPAIGSLYFLFRESII